MVEFLEQAPIVHKEVWANNIVRLVVEAPKITSKAQPGQFVMVKTSDALAPLLRRPLSIHKVEKNQLALLFKVLGQGTKILSQLDRGQELDLLGPLGKPFPVSKTSKDISCLIGGGMGIAPLYHLAQTLLASGNDKLTIMLGATNKEELQTLAADYKKLGLDPLTATVDGSMGFCGFVPELLKTEATDKIERIYCCGPWPMMKKVADFAKKTKTECFVSLETNMACGIGACLGCAVKSPAGGFVHVCQHGPVFSYEEVVWNQ